MEQSKPRSIVLRRSKNVRTIIQRLFLHSCFGSSLFQLWDLSPVGFCGLIRYSEKLFSFKSPSADDVYWDNFRRGQSWAARQKTKGLLRAEWVLIGMSGKSMHFHLLLSFRLNKRHIAMHCTQYFRVRWTQCVGWFWIWNLRNAKYWYILLQKCCLPKNKRKTVLVVSK